MQNKILLIIELPPPMHGMTYINQIIYKNLKDDDSYLFHIIKRKDDLKDNEKVKLKKVFGNFLLIYHAWESFFKSKADSVYILVSGSKLGILRDFLMYLPVVFKQKEFILHIHGFTHYKTYQNSLLYRLLFDIISNNAKLIVLCKKQQELTMNIMKKKSYILNNCLNSDEVVVKKSYKSNIKLCYISNISNRKGTINLIKAVKNRDNISLVIAGAFLDNKDEFLDILKDSENIKYVGFADESTKNKILKNSDIFCLPSKLEEGSPISIIEAMKYGLPILSSNKGCIPDMIKHSGYILEENYTQDDIIKGIEFIKNNYGRLSNNAMENFKNFYSVKSFIHNLKSILGEAKDV